MATRDGPVQRGTRLGDIAATVFTTEIRAARIQAGLSQAVVARAVGISRTEWGRIEAGRVHPRTWQLAAQMAAVVGLDLRLTLFANGAATRDAGQWRLVDRWVVALGAGWSWRYEARLPGARDQRAWDARGWHTVTRLVLKVDAETRLADHQAQLRRFNLKRADDPGGRFVLLVSDTRQNRAVLRAVDRAMRSEFPARGAEALRALVQGVDPGGDCLIVL